MFSRVMFHYGLNYKETLDLPVKTFWMLNRNINRLLAENEIRQMSILVSSSQNGDMIKETHEKLVLEIGTVVEQKEACELDRAGLEQLRNMVALVG